MDGELFSIFFTSETSRDIKKMFYQHLNIFKSCIIFQNLSPTLLILKNHTTFKGVQMILKHFFDISTGFRYKKWKRVLRPSIETSMGIVISEVM